MAYQVLTFVRDGGLRAAKGKREVLTRLAGASHNSVSASGRRGSRRSDVCAGKLAGCALTFFRPAGILLVCRSQDPAEREVMGTFNPSASAIDRQWHIIDAKGQVLGRIAAAAARLLQGKHKTTY